MKNPIPTKFSIIIIISLFAFSSCTPKTGEQIETLSGKTIFSHELDEFILNQMDSLGVIGISIAVINEAKVVYHRTFGLASIQDSIEVDRNTIFEAASLSKPFFAYYTMKLVGQGILDLDTPLFEYLPYSDIEDDERYKQITARMVLSHSTGFPNWRFFYPENRLFIQFSPGTEFFYSGEGYMYLGKVIAHLKKCSLNQLDSDIQVKVNIPLEIKHAYFGKNEHISNHKAIGYIEGKTVEDIWDRTAFNPAASLHTGAQDYARLLIAIMTKNGLNHELINEMLNEHIQVPADDAFRTEDGYDSWALGIGIKKISDKIYYGHDGENGNFQSHFLFDRDKKNGYVFFTNCDRGYSFNKKLEKFMIE